MNDAINSMQSTIPAFSVSKVSLSEFKILFGVIELIEELIFLLVGKVANSSNHFIPSFEQLLDYM
jgi:hypothetical protein